MSAVYETMWKNIVDTYENTVRRRKAVVCMAGNYGKNANMHS
jgi:hypothetical protein